MAKEKVELHDNDYVALINRLKIKPGDVLIFRIPRRFNPPSDRIKDLMEYVGSHGGYVLFVTKEIEVEKLPEEQMEKLGWVRKHANSKDK